MPFHLSICLTLSAFVWFVIGLVVEDLHIELPNFLGFILGMVQILIHGMYKKPNKGVVEEMKLSQHVIKIVNLRTSEIHPIDDEVAYAEEGNTNKKMVEVKPIQECKANVEI
ncbi:hypothetical protein Leryth_010797 [Lithospermum erythrorhizon]|uniref:Uncharacterized protein n=1 Tax=Lithospermum erythrorhizon TaxID=34254 RepID=A0AAV3PRU5_LITER|nr:hypothetical protein Leryth_010797 [Lithospermum erythrorhizon]